MKQIWNKLLVPLSVCAAFGWWGMLYPQLAMTPDTYRVVREDGTVQEASEVIEWDFEGSVYLKILDAAPGQVRFRSGILKSLAECLETWIKKE